MFISGRALPAIIIAIVSLVLTGPLPAQELAPTGVRSSALRLPAALRALLAWRRVDAFGGAEQIAPFISSFGDLVPLGGEPAEKLESTTAICYLDPALPTLDLQLIANLSTIAVATLGERITLPATSGTLSELSIVIDTAVGDTIDLAIVRDSLFKTNLGDLHLMNIWNTDSSTFWDGLINDGCLLWKTAIPVASVTFHRPFLVAVPSLLVPQNFFITVAPHFSASANAFTSNLLVQGDDGPAVPRTTDNTHSAMLYVDLTTSSLYSAVLDSSLYKTGGVPIYSNLNFTAYIANSSKAVAVPAPDVQVQLYPNPAHDILQLELPSDASEIVLFDALGTNRYSASAPAGRSTIDVHTLPAGVYLLRAKIAGAASARTVVISR